MAEKRESVRIKDVASHKVLDEAARLRRMRKALEALEKDNYQDDPHANLVMHKKAPKFEETLEGKKRRKLRSEPFKNRFRKSFVALLEEEDQTPGKPNYHSACVPPSKFPNRKFCSVCGFDCAYTCVQCGSNFCSIKCLGVHRETRCLKWTA